MAKNAADAIAADTVALATAGAKHFLWFDLPPLGQVPSFNDSPNPLVRLLGKPVGDSAALIFNTEIALDAAVLKHRYGVDITIIHTYALFNAIVANPGEVRVCQREGRGMVRPGWSRDVCLE